jgi:hypothetical protein
LEVFLLLCLFLGAIVPGAAVVLWPFGIVLYVLLKRGDDAMSDAVAAYNEDGGTWSSFWAVVVSILAFAGVGLAGASVLMWLSMEGAI